MIRAWLLAASLLLFPALAAAAPAADDLPVLRQHVTDLTGTLTVAQVTELESSLAALEKRKGSQLMVLMVPTTGERALEDYSLAVVEKNRVGRAKIDDGLLLLIAKDDRKARIEVGYGLEGVVTDALSSRVIREYLAPRFREGDYFGGIREATATLAKLVDGEALPAPMAPAAKDSGSPPLMFAVMLGLFVGLFAGGTGMRPVTIRRIGAGVVAAGLGWLIFSGSLAAAAAAIVAFLLSGGRTGRFGSGGGGFGTFPTGGWGGGGGGWGSGSGGGGGWSGGGGSFGGGGASGGW